MKRTQRKQKTFCCCSGAADQSVSIKRVNTVERKCGHLSARHTISCPASLLTAPKMKFAALQPVILMTCQLELISSFCFSDIAPYRPRSRISSVWVMAAADGKESRLVQKVFLHSFYLVCVEKGSIFLPPLHTVLS